PVERHPLPPALLASFSLLCSSSLAPPPRCTLFPYTTLFRSRLAAPSIVVDLGRIAGLNHIRQSGDQIVIGAMTPHADVASSKILHDSCPLLAQAASQIGDIQVRNRGTIGGSLAAAHPAADYPAAVLAPDAEIVAISRSGE